MICPLCRQRKARRGCPARGDLICPVCCATKRLVEIACPSDCTYLAGAQKHPPAQVRRQREADVRTLAASFGALTERQYRLGFLLLAVVARHQRSGGLAPFSDVDVADAAAAVAAGFETASRGVIYEPTPPSSLSAGLADELKRVLAEVSRGASAAFEREAAEVLRAIEHGARSAPGGPRSYLDLVSRVLPAGEGASRPGGDAEGGEGPAIILP
jgi:hypothetical protein